MSTPAQLQYLGPVEISSIAPLKGYTGTETELAISGSNLMLLLGYTRAFCAVGNNRFELTIVDHTHAYCSILGPLSPKHTAVTIAVDEEHRYHFASVSMDFTFDQPPQLLHVHPKVFRAGG